MSSENNQHRALRIFTWHVHGSYLYYLSQGDYELYIPVDRQENQALSFGYYGRGTTFPFGANVIEVDVAETPAMSFDCILFQDRKQFLIDQWEMLSGLQRRLPRVFIEHNAPEPHPTDSVHPLNDPKTTLVHVTHFNRLMWENQVPCVEVIEHGITPATEKYAGDIPKGLIVINHLFERGRKLGADIVRELQGQVPLDWVGMGNKINGGLGEVLHPDLPAFSSHYRFLFNPIRHTSLALSVLEAMMIGIPVVTLATTEYATLIRNGVNGFCSNNLQVLTEAMKALIADPQLAREIGAKGKETVESHYNIRRFTEDWKMRFVKSINGEKEMLHEKNNVYK